MEANSLITPGSQSGGKVTLYTGRMIWNRRRWIKDPETGNRVSRSNAAGEMITTAVPELRIVEDALWERVQARLQGVSRPQASRAGGDADGASRGPWLDRRARHLSSGKVFCGACGSRFEAIGKDYLACHQAANTVRLRRSRLEGAVLQAMSSGLMQPEAVGIFIEEFTAEWNRIAGEASASREAQRRELEGIQGKRGDDALGDQARVSLAAGVFQHHGMSSSMLLLGQPLTRRDSSSAK